MLQHASDQAGSLDSLEAVDLFCLDLKKDFEVNWRVALAPPGSEVITTAIADMGPLTSIQNQGLVPMNADVEPDALNKAAASVRAAANPRTRAIVVVHRAGLAADLGVLLAIGPDIGRFGPQPHKLSPHFIADPSPASSLLAIIGIARLRGVKGF